MIIPASLLDATGNVLVLSAHYIEFEEYTIELTFSIFGVYASYTEQRGRSGGA